MSFASSALAGAVEFRLTSTGPPATEIPLGGVFYVVVTECCAEDVDIKQIDGNILLVNLRTSDYIWLPLKVHDRDLVAGPIQAKGPYDEATIPYSLEAIEGDMINAQTSLVGGLTITAKVGSPVVSLSTPIALPGTTVRLTLNLAPEHDLPRLHLVLNLPTGWQAFPDGIMTTTTEGFLWPDSIPEGLVTPLPLLIEIPPKAAGRYPLAIHLSELALDQRTTLIVADHLPPEVVVAHWDVKTEQLDLTLPPTVSYEQLCWAASHVGERLPHSATDLSKRILENLTKCWQSEQTAYTRPVLPTAPLSETEKPEEEVVPKPEEKEEEVESPPPAVHEPLDTEKPEETAQEEPAQPSPPSEHEEVGPLVAHWTFDEGLGNVAGNETVGGTDATLHDLSWTEGKLGSAIQFSRSESYAEAPNSDNLALADNFTITAWVNLTEVGTGRQVLFQKKVVGESDLFTNYTLYAQWTHDAIALVVGDGRRRVGYLSDRGIETANEWHHIAVAFGDGKVRFYIDGEPAGEKAATVHPYLNDGPLLIGRLTASDGTPLFAFQGILDDLRIYNTVLTQQEIKSRNE